MTIQTVFELCQPRADVLAGEIACSLAGKEVVVARVRKSDEAGIALGAETLRELFGGEPTLNLLDELSVYLRKVRNLPNAKDQLTAFLTSLFKAVEGAPPWSTHWPSARTNEPPTPIPTRISSSPTRWRRRREFRPARPLY